MIENYSSPPASALPNYHYLETKNLEKDSKGQAGSHQAGVLLPAFHTRCISPVAKLASYSLCTVPNWATGCMRLCSWAEMLARSRSTLWYLQERGSLRELDTVYLGYWTYAVLSGKMLEIKRWWAGWGIEAGFTIICFPSANTGERYMAIQSTRQSMDLSSGLVLLWNFSMATCKSLTLLGEFLSLKMKRWDWLTSRVFPGYLYALIPTGLVLALKWQFWNGNSFLDSGGKGGGCLDLYKDRTSGQTLKITTNPHCIWKVLQGHLIFFLFMKIKLQLLWG